MLQEHDVLKFDGLGVKVELSRRAPEIKDIPAAERERLAAEEEEKITFAHVEGNR